MADLKVEDIVYYFNDSNALITTIDGDRISIKDSIYTEGHYYKKGDARVTLDYLNNNHYIVKKETNAIYDKFNNIIGYTDINYLDPYRSILINVHTINKRGEIIRKLYHPEVYNEPWFKEKFILNNDKIFEDKYLNPISYNISTKTRGIPFENLSIPENTKKSKLPDTYIKTYGKKYTFGVELETITGFVPPFLSYFAEFDSVKDGSLRHKDDNEVYGYEYVTGVYKGDQGLKQLKFLCRELSIYTNVNYQCGVHVHLGGFNPTKENIVLLYNLCYNLQHEILSILPNSRRNNEYCRLLPNFLFADLPLNKLKDINILKSYNYLYKIAENFEGSKLKNYNKKTDHPYGFKCQYNHATIRYCWVNFIPLMFNTRGIRVHTIEFRPMYGTLNYNIIKNWLLICMALIDVVENYKQELYNGDITNLTDVINLSYKSNAFSILKFIENNKMLYSSTVEIEDIKDNYRLLYEPINSISNEEYLSIKNL